MQRSARQGVAIPACRGADWELLASEPGACVVPIEQLRDLELHGSSLRERPERGTGRLTLVHCDLSGADLRGLDLAGWEFHDCNLNDARLTGTRLDSALFMGGHARGAIFIDADLAGARSAGRAHPG